MSKGQQYFSESTPNHFSVITYILNKSSIQFWKWFLISSVVLGQYSILFPNIFWLALSQSLSELLTCVNTHWLLGWFSIFKLGTDLFGTNFNTLHNNCSKYPQNCQMFKCSCELVDWQTADNKTYQNCSD